VTSSARSLVAYFPDDSLSVVVLVNAEPVDIGRVEAAITDAWYGAAGSPDSPLKATHDGPPTEANPRRR
jgi:hypothetical protein